MLRNSLSCNSRNTCNHPVTGLSSDKLSMPFRSDRKWRLFERWEKVVDFPWGICPFFLFEEYIYIYIYVRQPRSTPRRFPPNLLTPLRGIFFQATRISPIKVFVTIRCSIRLGNSVLWKQVSRILIRSSKRKFSRRFRTIALIFRASEVGSSRANGRAEMTKGNNKFLLAPPPPKGERKREARCPLEVVKEVAVKAPGRVVAKSWSKKGGGSFGGAKREER